MLPGDACRLTWTQIGTKGNTEILFGETAVAGQNRPDNQSKNLAQHEADRDGKQPDERDKTKG